MAYDIILPEEALELADQYTLKDLLECPAFKAFLVSAIGNGVRHFDKFSDLVDDRDELLMFRLEKFMRSIPYDVRNACFEQVGVLYREWKERSVVSPDRGAVSQDRTAHPVVRRTSPQVHGLRS